MINTASKCNHRVTKSAHSMLILHAFFLLNLLTTCDIALLPHLLHPYTRLNDFSGSDSIVLRSSETTVQPLVLNLTTVLFFLLRNQLIVLGVGGSSYVDSSFSPKEFSPPPTYSINVSCHTDCSPVVC